MHSGSLWVPMQHLGRECPGPGPGLALDPRPGPSFGGLSSSPLFPQSPLGARVGFAGLVVGEWCRLAPRTRGRVPGGDSEPEQHPWGCWRKYTAWRCSTKRSWGPWASTLRCHVEEVRARLWAGGVGCPRRPLRGFGRALWSGLFSGPWRKRPTVYRDFFTLQPDSKKSDGVEALVRLF